MPIQCPSCQNAIRLKEANPGRYTLRCPKCQEKFQLTVPEDRADPPVVSAIRSEQETITAETVPASGTEKPGADGFETGHPVAVAEPLIEAQAGRVPSTLGGYPIIRSLGQVGMGTVYLARQRALQRIVALKVMRPDWSKNPTFVSRFTRDAYAAAQLVHHHLTQVYDLGEDRGARYVSTEYVPGKSLADLLREQKRLDPEVAVVYVLQAARGMKAAHDQALIHRDIKPDNLLLDDQGVVKVADLGLSKTPSVAEVEAAMEAGVATVTRPSPKGIATEGGTSPITLVNAAMGTPAFMAPEQAQDPTSVDARADLYSLGCTLYNLVTGRPPFEATTAVELISKHQNEPIVPPDLIVPRVSKALSELILKMTARRPEDRYANLGEVIRALEDVLGLPGGGVFSPTEEQANLLTRCAETFHQAPSARLRRKIILGVVAGCAGLVVLCVLARQPFLAGGFLGLGLMTALAYFVVDGVKRKSYLFLKVVDLLVGGSPTDWLIAVAVLVLAVTLLWVFHLFWAWVAFGILAAMAAFYVHSTIDKKVEDERKESVERTRAMIRSLRLVGLDEDAIRQFVCKYSRPHWEEFYEALFGYEAKLSARRRWGRDEQGRRRPRFSPWRDWVIAWIDEKQQARRAARDKALIQKIEEKSLEAQGVNLMTARRKAERTAEAMVAVAAERKAAARQPAAALDHPPTPIGKALREAALRPEDVLVERESGLTERSLEDRLGWLVGPKVRFLAGALLMAGFVAWVHQNEIITREHLVKLKDAASRAAETQDVEALRDVTLGIKLDKPTQELKVSMPSEVPPNASRLFRLFNGFHPGVVGLILLVSSLFRGVRLGLFAFAGAAVAFLGPALGLPRLGPLDPALASMAVGAALGVIGIAFFRSRD